MEQPGAKRSKAVEQSIKVTNSPEVTGLRDRFIGIELIDDQAKMSETVRELREVFENDFLSQVSGQQPPVNG
jgi:hypothetical protein